MKQGVALGLMQTGKNVFLTGQAGSGKTYILNRYIDFLRAHEVEPAITASTGIAATHIGGTTIHSWSGLGIKPFLTDYDIELLQEKQYLWKRFEKAKVLVLDEISMVSPDFLDSIDKVLRAFRFSAEPFRGLQVIFSGDFFQLPPVRSSTANPDKTYAWQAEVWSKLDLQICYLEEQHRQSGVSELNQVLNEIRSGEVSEESMNILRGRYKKTTPFDTEPTKLYTHNIDVDAINYRELDALPALPRFFEMIPKGNKKLVETLKKGSLAQEKLALKKDARVLFVKNNYEKGYMNGSTGIVTDFTDEGWPVVELVSGAEIIATPDMWAMEESGKVLASIAQVPLRLAWAITIHKSQGMSLDSAEIDLSKAFASGQGYVALSRLRSIEGLKLMGCNQQALSVDPAVLVLDDTLQEQADEHEAMYMSHTEDDKLDLVTKSLKAKGASLDEKIVLENTKVLKKKRKKKQTGARGTHDETKDLIKKEYSIEEMAYTRDISEDTIMKHIAVLKKYEPKLNIDYLNPGDDICESVKNAVEVIKEKKDADDFLEDGEMRLRAIYEYLDKKIDYEEIKLGLLFV